jgi:hypothetical protein
VTTTEWIAMACRPGERKILHKKRSPCLAKACTRGQPARAGVDPFRTRRKGGPACYAPPIRVASRHGSGSDAERERILLSPRRLHSSNPYPLRNLFLFLDRVPAPPFQLTRPPVILTSFSTRRNTPAGA